MKKAKNFMLFALTALAISGCTSVKKYKNEVTQDEFVEKVKQKFEDVKIGDLVRLEGYTLPSFEYSCSGKEKSCDNIYNKNGKVVRKDTSLTKFKYSDRYDSESNIYNYKEQNYYKMSRYGTVDVDKEKIDKVYQKAGEDEGYKVDKLAKVYSKKKAYEPSLKAMRNIHETIETTYDRFTELKEDTKCYIDKEVYTVVIKSEYVANEGKENEYNVTKTNIHQIRFTKNGFVEIDSYNLLQNGSSMDFVEKSEEKTTFKFKKVNLKEVNLKKYIDISEEDK